MTDDDRGVPLGHYAQHHPTAGVLFICGACQASRDVPVARVIARLQALGVGGAQTGVREVARFAERPCPKCGAMKWSSRPAFRL